MRETGERKKRRRGSGFGWLVALAMIAWLSLTAGMLLFIDARTVRFYVYGEDDMTIEYGTDFVDPGVYAVTAGRLFGESEKHLDVQSSGTVDGHRLGTYVLRYTARFAFSDYSTERRVTVADRTPPVIELRHIEGYEPTWMTGYSEEGYAAWDAVDGDLTDKVTILRLDDRIRYTVTDSAGNTAYTERMIPNTNYRLPVITVLGDPETVVQAGLWYQDPGAAVSDSLGNDLSAWLVTEGTVIPWVAGDYEITYSVTSQLGETVSASRHVKVTPVGIPKTVTPTEKTIYLTFDDGPGPYTERLLEILDRYGAKATFFVTTQDKRYVDLIGKAFRAGHSIGVHTASHNYNYIYASEQDYFDDFFTMEEVIYQQTGEYTRLFRFPGGSSNTVSRINPGIMSRLARAMTDMGYQYFDWNVYSGDAGETSKSDQIAQNIKDGCSEHRVSIVLQHDIKDYSVAAVESVLQWGAANGYVFRALSLDSPAAHHGLNN